MKEESNAHQLEKMLPDEELGVIRHKEYPGKLKLTLKFLQIYWKSVFVVTWPLLMLPIIFCNDGGKAGDKFRCLYVMAIMAGYWITECIPLYMTGLMPVFMFPLLNVLSSAETTQMYFKEVNMMFMGGVLLATCVEASNLHNRIALYTIMKVGCSPRKLHFGLMLITMILSMWLVNSACAAMMCPIIKAILEEMETQGIGCFFEPQTEEEKENNEPPRPSKSTLAFYLGIAYATTIGGLGTLVGTTANLSYRGAVEDRFTAPGSESIEFVPWMLQNTPILIVLTVLSWLWLNYFYMGMFRPDSPEGKWAKAASDKQDVAFKVMKERYRALGKVTWHEAWVGFLFFVCMCLWLMKSPKFMDGWGDLLVGDWIDPKNKGKYIKDSVPALLILFFMIIIPNTPKCLYCWSKDPEKRPTKSGPGLVTWKVLNQRMPWGMLFLLGGGFAIGEAGKQSGMSNWLGGQLNALKDLPPFLVMALSTAFASFLTEIMSNTAMAVLLMPIVLEMAVAMKVHPFFFGNPTAIACSWCFLLPAGTPANAIAAGYANIRTIDMAKGGSVVKIMTYIITILACPTFGLVFWPDLLTFPSWAAAPVTPKVIKPACVNEVINVVNTTVLPLINSTVGFLNTTLNQN